MSTRERVASRRLSGPLAMLLVAALSLGCGARTGIVTPQDASPDASPCCEEGTGCDPTDMDGDGYCPSRRCWEELGCVGWDCDDLDPTVWDEDDCPAE